MEIYEFGNLLVPGQVSTLAISTYKYLITIEFVH